MASRLRPVDLAELRGLCLAVELGSLGRAAAALQISQPALSKRIRELELFAGTALLVRTPRGVTATEAGERLYRAARPLLAHAGAVERLLDELGGRQRPVRLAASHTIAEYVLPEPLAAYRERLGHGFALELVAANSAVVRDLVREGRADLGLAAIAPSGPDPELRERVVGDDEVVVGVVADHPWAAAGAPVALAEALATPMVMRDPSANTRQVLDVALRERGLSATAPLAEVGSTAAAVSVAVARGVPALLSARAVAASGGLVAVRIAELSLRRAFALVEPRAGLESPEARELGAYLSDVLS